MTNRIDKELVERNIFETRSKAQYALDNSLVYLNGKLVNKANTLVSNTYQIEIVGIPLFYVSKNW